MNYFTEQEITQMQLAVTERTKAENIINKKYLDLYSACIAESYECDSESQKTFESLMKELKLIDEMRDALGLSSMRYKLRTYADD